MEVQEDSSGGTGGTGSTGAPGPSWSGSGVPRASAERPREASGAGVAGMAFAPFRRRLAGIGIDVALTLAVLRLFEAVLGLDASGADLNDPAVQAMLTRAFVAETVFVTAAFWLWNSIGWSPGKRAVGLRVVAEDGTPPGAGRAFARTAGSLVSVLALGLGYVWATWDPRSQTWHDKMASTYVVRAPATTAPGG